MTKRLQLAAGGWGRNCCWRCLYLELSNRGIAQRRTVRDKIRSRIRVVGDSRQCTRYSRRSVQLVPFAGSRGSISASGATASPEAEAICSRELHEGLVGDDVDCNQVSSPFCILIGTHRSQSATPEQGDRACLDSRQFPLPGDATMNHQECV